jgi:oxygen-independent coproporphyrinogen III oxidase
MAGIYIHIPFCKQACHYCDFHFSTSLKNKDAFLAALVKEIELQKNYFDTSEIINTIYFGGGTPSLLSQKEIEFIMEHLHKYFTIDNRAEITLEANPDDLTPAKSEELSRTPINRLSIGIQSFFDEDLKWMNRAHNSLQASSAVKNAQDKGFENITIDLIYGTSTLSNENWTENLQRTFDLKIKHISAYCLTIEPKTVLGHQLKNKMIEGVDEQKSAMQFEKMLEEMKKNNFVQYEISNFCVGNNYSIHNSNYWLQKSYLGLGPSAHSFNGTGRRWNISNNALYIKALENNTINYTEEILSKNQQYNEYILTSLRTFWGTDLTYIKNNFGNQFVTTCIKEVQPYITKKQVQLIDNKLFLTDAGKLFADKITGDLFI